jgi:hypothetical protein
MPLKTFDTKEDFDDAYSLGYESIELNYNRVVMMPYCRTRAEGLMNATELPFDTSILFVGAGFGWTIEAMEDLGYMAIFGFDSSPYINSKKDLSENDEIEEKILRKGFSLSSGEGLKIKNNLYSTKARSRTRRNILHGNINDSSFRRLIGSNFSVAISETVISTLTDQEAVDLSNDLRKVNRDIVVYHLEVLRQDDSNSQDPGYNWKSLEEWKALLPNDFIISVHDFRMI